MSTTEIDKQKCTEIDKQKCRDAVDNTNPDPDMIQILGDTHPVDIVARKLCFIRRGNTSINGPSLTDYLTARDVLILLKLAGFIVDPLSEE